MWILFNNRFEEKHLPATSPVMVDYTITIIFQYFTNDKLGEKRAEMDTAYQALIGINKAQITVYICLYFVLMLEWLNFLIMVFCPDFIFAKPLGTC